MQTERPVLMLMGPTASGKTDLALALAAKRDCELISVDSALIYRGMDIGTAKPCAETLRRFPHHLVDIREPWETYSAAEFRRDALALIERIHGAARLPILVGGTMLYFRVLLEGIDELPPADPAVRARINARLRSDGPQALHRELQRVDPQAAARIHPNNRQRLQRALEVWHTSAMPMSSLHTGRANRAPPWRALQIAIAPKDREVLHQRISTRFRAMLESGFVDEVARLRALPSFNPDLPSMRAVGYRQVLQHLAGQLTYAQMVERGIIATRQLAKRQLTWLRGWPGLEWILTDAAQQCVATEGVSQEARGLATSPVDQALNLMQRAAI